MLNALHSPLTDEQTFLLRAAVETPPPDDTVDPLQHVDTTEHGHVDTPEDSLHGHVDTPEDSLHVAAHVESLQHPLSIDHDVVHEAVLEGDVVHEAVLEGDVVHEAVLEGDVVHEVVLDGDVVHEAVLEGDVVLEGDSLDTPPSLDTPFVRSSSHADFLCVGQFIGVFGPLLGLPQISLDMTEDGLDRKYHNGHEAYIEACTNAIERILIILLRRCGISTTNERLSKTLYKYFLERDLYLAGCFQDNIIYRDLPNVDKLAILKAVCLNQFDDNVKFKTEFNSKYGPEELRWEPLGRDFDSNQYWYISDFHNSHRLYKWGYPYTEDSWTLLSSYRDELRMVVERVSPPDPQEVMEGKLGELVKESKSLAEPARPKKKKKKKVTVDGKEETVEEEVVHNARGIESGRRSMRNMGARKVYTEGDGEGSDSEEDEDEYKVSSSEEEKIPQPKYQRPPPLHSHKKKDRKRSLRKQPVSSFRTIDFTKLQQQGLRESNLSSSPGFSQSPSIPSINNESNGFSPTNSLTSDHTGYNNNVTVESVAASVFDFDEPPSTKHSVFDEPPPAKHSVFDEVDKDFKENAHNGHATTFHNNHSPDQKTWTYQPPLKEESKVVVETICHIKCEDISDSFLNIESKECSVEDPFEFPPDLPNVEIKEEEEEEEDPFDFCPPDLNDRFKGMLQGPDYVPVKRKPPPAPRVFLNQQVRRKPLSEPRQRRRRVVEEVYYEPAPLYSSEFLELLQLIPSIANYEKPAEAKDVCWKCNGEEDVDKMLFCDGCDLATYHMRCCRPEIEEVPEGDWYCPVCEQCVLYIKLRERLRRLGGRLRKPKKQRAPLTPVKSSVHKERLKEPKIEPREHRVKPEPPPKQQKGPILVSKNDLEFEFPPKKEQPSKPAMAPHDSPQRSSTPVRQNPISERSERSERSEYSSPKKQNKSPCHYTADDFLAQPLFHKLDVTKIPQPQKRFVPYEEYELQPRKTKVMSITYDDETLAKESEKRGLSTSGHVAMDTVQLSVEQKAALAAWEQMERSYHQSEESEESSDTS